MKTIEFLEKVREMKKAVLTTNDISRVINKPANYTRIFTNRLKKNGILEKIERGKYCLQGSHEYQVASNLVFPSYLSFYTGLRFYDFTTQLPRTVFVACLKPKKEIMTSSYNIKFIKLDKKRFFGYNRIEFGKTFIFVAEPEKVILDCLYLPEYAPISESFEAIRSKEFDLDRLLDYSLKMGSIVILKRLGYMLELAGLDIYNKIKSKLNTRTDLLNPYLPPKNPNKKWKLYINEKLNGEFA